MKKTFFTAFLTLILAVYAQAYRVEGPLLKTDSGMPVRLASVYVHTAYQSDSAAVDDAFSALKKQGIKLVKISAAATGAAQGSLQPEPGRFDENALKKLDAIVSAAAKNDISLIIALSDPDSKETYRQWAGGSNADIFYKDKLTRGRFKKFITTLLSRVNTVSGVKYAADPAIFAWDLCDRADNINDATGMSMYNWAVEMSAFVKSLDTGHFIMMGLKDGFTIGDSVNGSDIFLIPNIDLAFYAATEFSEKGQVDALTAISDSTKAISAASGKPVILFYTGKAGIFDAAKAHMEAGGAIVMYNETAEQEQLVRTSAYTGSITDGVPAVTVNKVSATADVYAASVSFELSREAEVKVIYGTSLPLKQSALFKGTAFKGIVKIDGLKPGSEYMFQVMAQEPATGASGMSKVMKFKTTPPKRAAAVKFTMSKNIITAKDGDFYDGKKIYRYLGANCYYLRYYAPGRRDKASQSEAEITTARRKNMDYVLSEAAKIGLKVMRIGSNGEAVTEEEAKTADPLRYIRIGPDKFNEKALVEFDHVMEAARRNNIRVIIHFTDNWEYYGGVGVYAKWAGVSREEFWSNEQCKKYYKQTVDAWVDRINTVSGIKYKDDPVLFCWELCNEPWDRNDVTGKELARWIDEMAGYIKSKDPKHMVSTGSDSFFLKEDGTHYSGSDFIQDHQSKNIDFCTYHVYPTYEHNRFSLNTTKYLIDKWVDAGRTLGKPVVMEEFGITKDGEYNRNIWIDEMLTEFYARGGKGVNYWFFRDASYTADDGFAFTPEETETVNVFIKHANIINKGGY
ncbi:MAG: cellulase family glycosylhydrolase [Spirochaetia bacterium]|nr:cellulase family glycosylhydrolase [Spirochaetia bacterium]